MFLRFGKMPIPTARSDSRQEPSTRNCSNAVSLRADTGLARLPLRPVSPVGQRRPLSQEAQTYRFSS